VPILTSSIEQIAKIKSYAQNKFKEEEFDITVDQQLISKEFEFR
jgi:hypothetical protein